MGGAAWKQRQEQESPALETYEQRTEQQSRQGGGRGCARGGVCVLKRDQTVGMPCVTHDLGVEGAGAVLGDL